MLSRSMYYRNTFLSFYTQKQARERYDFDLYSVLNGAHLMLNALRVRDLIFVPGNNLINNIKNT